MMGSETKNILAETANRILADHVTKDVLNTADNGKWSDDLWQILEQNGLTQPLVAEESGGLGATWEDAFVIAFACGYHRAPVPLVETMVAGWVLGRAGLDVPSGPIALISMPSEISFDDGRLAGSAAGVPWAGEAAHGVFLGYGKVACVAMKQGLIEPDFNLGGDPRDQVQFNDVEIIASGHLDVDCELFVGQALGAVMRAAQMAGAMERAIELAVTHAQDREQFGRAIAKFQAIQQSLAVAAARAAEARVAAEAAFAALDKALAANGDGLDTALWDIAAAKVVAGEAAGIVYDTAHQVHGAIGFTFEHELHFATRRLWAWRGEFGSETEWAEYLGRMVLAGKAESLWPSLVAQQT